MRKLLFGFLLCCFVQQGIACGFWLIPRRPIGFGNHNFLAPSWSPRGKFHSPVTGNNYNPFSVFNPGRFILPMPVRSYAGSSFPGEAVFCRMENHFLNRYGVKFSIHAGGYRE